MAPPTAAFTRQACAIFAVALAVRLIHVWQIRRAPFFDVLMGDAKAYDEWAQRIAAGDWVGRDVFYQAPLYPYFLGLIYATAGRSLLLARVCQAVIGAGSCVLLGLAARRIFSHRVGLLAGVGLALYAPAIFFDGLLQKSALDLFFLCLMLWLISAPPTPDRKSRWVALGLAAGGLSLTRENALAFIVVILVWALARERTPRRDRWLDAGAFLIGLALVLSPVVIRNAFVGGGVYVTTAQFGPNFYIGNNPGADGTYMSLRYGRGSPEYERQDATELAEQALQRPLSPGEVSSYWTSRALDFIGSHPTAWLKLTARKFALLWNATEMLDTESQETYAEWSWPVRILGYVGNFGVLVPLAFLGMCLTWSERRRLRVIYALVGVYAASVVMFYVFARYRLPLVPFLMLFASAAVAAVVERPAALRDRRMVIVATVAVAVVANWRMLSPDLMRAITENNLAVELQATGRYDEATAHYQRAIALRSDYAPAYNNMGTALRAKGDLRGAIDTYQRAIHLQPDYPDVEYNLANAYLADGQLDEAIAHFRQALHARPGSVETHNNLGIALASRGRLDEAVLEFRAALRLDPQSAQTERNLGDALSSQRNPEAVEHLQRAVQLLPGNADAHYDLASVFLELRRYDDAIVEFKATLALTPTSAEARNNLGIAFASTGRIDDAIAQFREALRLQPGFAEAQRNLDQALRLRR